MATRKCPTCDREISSDLRIEVNIAGFVRVYLGLKCATCGTLYPDSDPTAQVAAVRA